LENLGHDPSDRIKAMDLAQHYGDKIHTGVFYRDPAPPPTYGDYVRERQAEFAAKAPSRANVLDMFVPEA
jgi:2-oxoglutarate ferredoxin oxidoreductase subunit beta